MGSPGDKVGSCRIVCMLGYINIESCNVKKVFPIVLGAPADGFHTPGKFILNINLCCPEQGISRCDNSRHEINDIPFKQDTFIGFMKIFTKKEDCLSFDKMVSSREQIASQATIPVDKKTASLLSRPFFSASLMLLYRVMAISMFLLKSGIILISG